MHSKCNTDPRVGTSNDHFYGQSQCRHGTVLPKGIDLSKFQQPPQILRKSMRLSPFLIA
jgi:hypothetical protein